MKDSVFFISALLSGDEKCPIIFACMVYKVYLI